MLLKPITTSAQWLTLFSKNAECQRAIPWQLESDASEAELAEIIPSLQAWQLGETSDGSHLTKAAKNYAQKIGDYRFLDVVRLFIKEEQRHGEALGRFLDAAKSLRIKKNWGDRMFRAVRYAIPSMEIWATPVLMVETHALVYYKALHDATKSRVLKAICNQILHDEISHIRFQAQRLAILHRNRPEILRRLTIAAQRVFFAGVTCAVWIGHRRALRAGGHTFGSYWRIVWKKMEHSWAMANPRRYDFSPLFDHASESVASALSPQM